MTPLGVGEASQSILVPSRVVGFLALAGLLVALLLIHGGSLPAVALLLVGALAFANGANDFPKTIATLAGSGALSHRRTLALGTMATLLGGGIAAVAASSLVHLFSAGGIVVAEATGSPGFPVALVGGAAAWVLLATRGGLPVSTTHALVGASVGAALASYGAGGVHWQTLAGVVAIPLFLGPVVAAPTGLALARVSTMRRRFRRGSAHRWLHVASAFTAGAARALNDTPKLTGVGLLAAGLDGASPLSAVGLCIVALVVATMVAGGVYASARVGHTLGFRLATLDRDNGLAANATNSLLVGAASALGLPLSTTHVSGAALVGASYHRDPSHVRWRVAGDILMAWLVTLPGAALLAAGVLLGAERFGAA